MKKIVKRISIVLLIFVFSKIKVCAQDLDPRAYVRVPINGTLFISGFAYSHGNVLTDPALPLTDLTANVELTSIGVGRTFSFFGQTAQAMAILPYGFIQADALVNGLPQSATRSGLADLRIRMSVLLLGGKAASLGEFSKFRSRTVIGTSLYAIVPTGQYFADKLINLGTSRWSVKPEVALSQLIGQKWMLDLYSGVWIFTTNNSFYPGNSVRTQDPLIAFQAHLCYNINPRIWFALNTTFYVGGQSTVNGKYNDDRLENARIGATLALPVGKRNSLKIAFSKGAIIRMGADFSTITVGWSSVWFGKPKSSE
jgi:hypothetical protein